MREIKRCPTCEAKMVEYRHALNKNIVSCLYVLLKAGGMIQFSELNHKTSFNQRNNFQKLQYWDLIRKVSDQDGSRSGGHWKLTEVAMSFLRGKKYLHKTAVTYRNRVVRHEGDLIGITDLGWEPYRRRDDYAGDESARFDQMDFF